MRYVMLVCWKTGVGTERFIRPLNEETFNFVRICLSNRDYDSIRVENIEKEGR